MRIIGNWKMNCGGSDARGFTKELASSLKDFAGVRIGVAPPFTVLEAVLEELKGSALQVGSQNAHGERSGAFTGEVAATFIRDIGCSFALVGHSERRHVFGESSALVGQRLKGVLEADLRGVLCIGETIAEREGRATERVIKDQLTIALHDVSAESAKNVIVAYEPVWAIGTGKVATIEQIQEVHQFIQSWWAKRFPGNPKPEILYGGSVTPSNFAELASASEVNGALVGGASLKVDAFSEIVRIAAKANP